MTRTTWFLAGILIALIVATVWVMQRPGERSASSGDGDVLVRYDSASVDRMDIFLPSGMVKLVREGDIWMITSPLRAPADPHAVTAAIGQGTALKLKALVSANPAKQQLFQVDSTSVLVRVFAKGSEVAAFHVGKPGPTYTETYIRREGSKEVFLTEGMLSTIFARPAREWRNKAILGLRPEDIHAVTFHYGDTTFTLSKSDTVWNVDGVPATEYAVRGFLASLASLQCDDFIDTALTTVPPLAGMVEVNGTQIGFHQKPGDPMLTVITSASTQYYTMYAWRGEQVLKRRADFLKQTPQ
jgi:hypothetical protein